MKKRTTCILLFITLFTGTYAFTQDPPYLEIHHIGAGDGDATLIIAVDYTGVDGVDGNPVIDTCVVLIDGQRPENGDEVWRYVQDTITELFDGKRPKIDYIVASHLHADHIGGLINVIEGAYYEGDDDDGVTWTIEHAITREALIPDYTCQTDDILDDCYIDSEPTEVTRQVKIDFFNLLDQYNIYQPIIQPLDDIFNDDYCTFQSISMMCIVAGGATIDPETNKLYSFLPCTTGKYKNRSENDLSYGWLISFNGFHYVSMGDLGGSGTGNYVNGETPVTEYLVGHFDDDFYHLCANKISHHGSTESTDEDFVSDNNLTFAVIPANLRKYGSAPLPNQEAIERLLDHGEPTGQINETTITNIVYTFIPENPTEQESYWELYNFEYYNDVIIKIIDYPGYEDELTFTVTEVPKDSEFDYSDPDLPPIQEYTYTCSKGHNWGH